MYNGQERQIHTGLYKLFWTYGFIFIFLTFGSPVCLQVPRVELTLSELQEMATRQQQQIEAQQQMLVAKVTHACIRSHTAVGWIACQVL